MTRENLGGIWVIADQLANCLNTVSLELLGKAQELKNQLKTPEPVVAVIVGSDVEGMAEELGHYGAEEVIVMEHPKLELYQNETYALVLEEIIKERRPSILLMGATATGQDLASVLGIKLNTGVAAHCVDLRIDDEDNLVATVPAFGGKVLGGILCPSHRPQIATIKPGVLVKPSQNCDTSYSLTKHDPSAAVKRDRGRIKALGISRKESIGVALEEAEVVVAGGWGIGSKENWQLLEELANLLGGAVGCTRPAVDENWAEGEHQMIGTSGKAVRPKVYIGFGISGATHHICGIKDADLVISVNKDEKAPVFEVSDVHVMEDAGKILSSLIDAIKNKKELKGPKKEIDRGSNLPQEQTKGSVDMSDLLKRIDSVISEYIRPITYPVAVKFFKEDEELPPRTKIPTESLKYPVAFCQGVTMARKFGWTMAFYQKDQACPVAQVILGFVDEPDFIKDGSLVYPLYVESAEAGAKTQAATPKMPTADTHCIVVAPLHRATFEPDVIVVYGNAAQITRMSQGALYKEGGCIEAKIAGRGACGGEVTVPYLEQKCNVILPGGGERIFADTADDELAFAMPKAKFEDVIEGIIATHKGGVARIPTPAAGVNIRPQFPKYYSDLEKHCGL